MAAKQKCAGCGAPLTGAEDFDDVCNECDNLGDYDLDEPIDDNE